MSTFQFGQVRANSSLVFFLGDSCKAFLNLFPWVDHQSLVIPSHPYKRVSDIPDLEFEDLAATAMRTGSFLRAKRDASYASIAIQDGPHAGQTVFHTHFHVLPMMHDARWAESERPSTDLKSLEDQARALREQIKEHTYAIENLLFLKQRENPVRPEGDKEDMGFGLTEGSLIRWGNSHLGVVRPEYALRPGHCVVWLDTESDYGDELEALVATWMLAKHGAKALEECVKATGFTFVMEIPKALPCCPSQAPSTAVIHLIPRFKSDIPRNDKIYSSIDLLHKSLSKDNLVTAIDPQSWLSNLGASNQWNLDCSYSQLRGLLKEKLEQYE